MVLKNKSAIRKGVLSLASGPLRVHRPFSPVFSGAGTILYFHRVLENRPMPRIGNSDIEVSSGFLERVINHFIKKRYEILSLDEVYELLSSRSKRNRKFVSFTFDDGYIDAYSVVFDLFKSYSLPFALYLTTDFPDKTATLWWYLLEDLVLAHESLSINNAGCLMTFRATTWAEKVSAFNSLTSIIIQSGSDEDCLARVFEPYGVDTASSAKELMLDWEHVALMSKDPLVTVGAHTISHRTLSTLDEECVRTELADSRSIIEGHTGKRVEHLAYPYGNRESVGTREFRIAKSLGFKTATTTREANIFPGHADHLECLPRIGPKDTEDGLFQLELLTSGFLPAVRHGFKRVITV